jgi:hypothetical protein
MKLKCYHFYGIVKGDRAKIVRFDLAGFEMQKDVLLQLLASL